MRRPAHHRRGPLAEYDAWLHYRAHQMLPSNDPCHDDLVREGRGAIWQAHGRYQPGRGALPSWLTRHTTWHMTETLTRRRRTGTPTRRDGRHTVDDIPTTSLDSGDDTPGDETAGGISPASADMAPCTTTTARSAADDALSMGS
ncbi:sigma factor [Streptomyces sp. NPDC002835]